MTQTFVLPTYSERDFLVNVSANDLSRILITGNQSIFAHGVGPSASDFIDLQGSVRFEKGGVYRVRVRNEGEDDAISITYSESEYPVAVTDSYRALQGHLKAAQVAVYVLPYVGDSGVVAEVRNTDLGEVAPLIGGPDLIGYRRHPDGIEAF